MKKFFSMVSIVMAIASVSFVSCNNDDDVIKTIDPQQNPQQNSQQAQTPKEEKVEENYRAMKFWASDDLLEIADITSSGLTAGYSFNEGVTLTTKAGIAVNGKAGALFEAPKGNSAKISFTLKKDWKKIIEGKESFSLYCAMKQISQKGEEAKLNASDMKGTVFDQELDTLTEEDLKSFLEDILSYSLSF